MIKTAGAKEARLPGNPEPGLFYAVIAHAAGRAVLLALLFLLRLSGCRRSLSFFLLALAGFRALGIRNLYLLSGTEIVVLHAVHRC